ncbi:Spy/CpxP family protein refolding chaperone [Halosquirtibacter laminarini]|uniref:Spy/CpxP family protein refolding chaperone n=1 Tax=Halosquirtibacter laminarini TaxID=3374600 RepID=A0AC61NEH1_9BACT|nr:Spy/CpxP family protein refolding chaperone [Prolixibacteraceae bacterium]
MRRKTIAFLIVTVISSISFLTPAFGQPNKGKCKNNCTKECPRTKGLNLTEDQKSEIKEIRLASQKTMKPFMDQLRELTAHQKTLMTAEKPNQKEIDKNLEKIGDMMTELAKEKSHSTQEIRALLSDEQRIQFDQKIMRFKHKRGQKQCGRGR